MTTNGTAKTSQLFTGLALGVIGGVIAAIFSRKHTRDALRERGGESLGFLNQQAGKLRDTADDILRKGKDFIGPQCNSVRNDTEAEKQAYREKQRETLGG